MTELTPQQEAMLATAEDMGQKVDNLREAFEFMGRRITVLKRIIAGLVVALVLAAAGVVIGIVVAVNSNHTAHQAKDALSAAAVNKANAIQTCLAGNQSRASARQSWSFLYDTLLKQPRGKGQSQADYDKTLALIKALEAKTLKNYAPRDCGKLNH